MLNVKQASEKKRKKKNVEKNVEWKKQFVDERSDKYMVFSDRAEADYFEQDIQ